ncbi:PQQ-binding-like beta-propeller repeat protein [Paenibacillus sepulcri]|uniref:PQQ-binding-like beta-propeller repeat protein n=1 Tax=Paenibacillus sepulcri TaxID=359917 RepID=A0ABS7BWU0_9BACL|nr:PQQ-binding-like beta-propeller repeat protein [Paenibacillus sepulcri]
MTHNLSSPILSRNFDWSKQLKYEGPQKIKEKRWKVQFPNTLSISKPVIDDRNTIIFGTNSGDMIWVDPDGHVIRTRSYGDGVMSSSMINDDGNLLVALSSGNQDNHLMELSPTGEILWKCPIDSSFRFEPVLNNNGQLYGATRNELIKFDSRGHVLWRFACLNISCCPILDLQGNVHFTSRSDNGVYISLSEDGLLRWKKEMGKCFIDHAPIIDSHGNIYMLIADSESLHSLYSFDSEGNTNWVYALQDRGIISSPALSDTGCIVMGTTYFKLISLNLDGQLIWESDLGHTTQFTPILDRQSNIYLYTYEKKRKTSSHLWRLNDQGNVCWKHKMDNAIQWFSFNQENGFLTLSVDSDTFLLELTSYAYE